MKVKLTKEKVIQLHNALSEIGEEKPNAKFAYAVAKNLNVIEPEVKALMKAQEKSKEYQEYDSKRVSICREMANKDENGTPIMIGGIFQKDKDGIPQRVGGEFDIPDRAKLDKRIEKLKKEYKEAVDEQEIKIDEFNELIKEEIDIEFHRVKYEWIPKDKFKKDEDGDKQLVSGGIKPNHLAVMLCFIEGEPGDD